MIEKIDIIGLGALGTMYADFFTRSIGKENVRVLAGRERTLRYRREGVTFNNRKCDLNFCISEEERTPSQLMVFAVKYEHGDASIADVERMLDSYIQKDPSYWLLSDTIPTVGEARKKLVLMRRYNDEAGLGAQAGIPLIWSEQRDNSDVSLNMARENNGTYTLWVQDRFKYGTEDKWNAFKDGLENCRSGGDSLALSFLSTNGSGGYGHPYKYAKALNPRILGGEGLKGWIVIDFATAELAQAIYCNN